MQFTEIASSIKMAKRANESEETQDLLSPLPAIFGQRFNQGDAQISRSLGKSPSFSGGWPKSYGSSVTLLR